MIRLASFQCVCPLMPSHNTYRLTLVSLTLDEGYLVTAAPPDLESGVAPLSPPAQGGGCAATKYSVENDF